MKLLMIRHGQSEADVKNVIECNADFDLTDLGVEQAVELTKNLNVFSPFDAVYSSPLKRAYNTAKKISEKFGLPLVADGRIAERNVGKMAGMNREEAFKMFPAPEGGLKPHCKMGGGTGESMLNFRFRVLEFFSELEEKHSKDKIIVVTHGGVINCYLKEVLSAAGDVDFATGDTGMHFIEKICGRVSVRFLNFRFTPPGI